MYKQSFHSVFSISILFVLFFLGSAFAPVATTATTKASAEINRWEKLGQRRVNYGLDRDEIMVSAREGSFTALKLKIRQGGVNLHRCVVHFRNGQTQAVPIGQTLRPGQETRVLDLPGNRRIITKVVFWYDTKNFARRRGIVELWGRH